MIGRDVVSPADLVNVATRAACKRLPADSVDHVDVEPMIASDGGDALRVSVILTDRFAGELPGDVLMHTSLAVARAIERAGDERYAFVEYREGAGRDPDEDPAD